jgi:hypothetical protein
MYKWLSELSRIVCLFLTNGGLDVSLLEGLDIDVALHMLRRHHRPKNKAYTFFFHVRVYWLKSNFEFFSIFLASSMQTVYATP